MLIFEKKKKIMCYYNVPKRLESHLIITSNYILHVYLLNKIKITEINLQVSRCVYYIILIYDF